MRKLTETEIEGIECLLREGKPITEYYKAIMIDTNYGYLNRYLRE